MRNASHRHLPQRHRRRVVPGLRALRRVESSAPGRRARPSARSQHKLTRGTTYTRKHAVVAPVVVMTLAVAMVAGVSWGASPNDSGTKGSRPRPTATVTVTKTVTATAWVTGPTSTVTVPGPTTTVTAAGPTKTVTVTSTPSSTATATGTATATATATGTATPTSTPPAGTNVCTDQNAYVSWNGEEYVWIGDSGSTGWTNEWGNGPMDPYYADAGMWNANGYPVYQKTVFCDHDSWYADIKMNNNSGDGAVKTYPNTHVDFHNWGTGIEPALSSIPSLSSTFAHKSPTGTGLSYNWAFDLWLNQYDTEVMIWTDYANRGPWENKVASNVTIDGRQWDLWKAACCDAMAFMAAGQTSNNASFSGGTVNLKAFLNYLQNRGLVSQQATLTAVDYGVEAVSTGNVVKRFDVTDFSVTPLP